jgi:hypothetical protein
MLSERYRAVLVDVSYPAVDALEGSSVKGEDRIRRVQAHRVRLERLASRKWDGGEYEEVADLLHVQITAEDLNEGCGALAEAKPLNEQSVRVMLRGPQRPR